MPRELSMDAIRLLAALRGASSSARSDPENSPLKSAVLSPVHLTDRTLAELLGIPRRDVIDAAGELLAAGYLVLADGGGRWLGDLSEARRYDQVLRSRALQILRRRRDLRAAIRRASLRQLELVFPAHPSEESSAEWRG